MFNRGDNLQLSRMKTYLYSGDVMRKESLSHASHPCQPLQFSEFDEIFYRVPSTGAIVTLSSSVSLIYFYCSRLPSDGYALWNFSIWFSSGLFLTICMCFVHAC